MGGSEAIGAELPLRAAGMYAWSWHGKDRLVACSRGAQELFGLPPGPRRRPLGDYQRLVHIVDRPLLSATVSLALGGSVGDAPLEATFRIALPAGAHRWLTARGRLRRDQATGHMTMAGVLWQTTPCRSTANVMHHFLDRVCSSWQ